MEPFDFLNAGAFRARRFLWKCGLRLAGKPKPDYDNILKAPFIGVHAREVPKDLWRNGENPEDLFYESMQDLKDPRVLEIGSRRIVKPIERERLGPGHAYVGMDIQNGPNVDVVGDAHQLDSLFAPASFDGIISLAVFEHIAKPWQVARAINAILKPGGLVCIMTHHAYPNHELPWDFWRYGRDAFGTIFNASSGFEIVAGGLGNSAKVRKPDRYWGAQFGGRHFLFTGVLARKIGSPQPVDQTWNYDYRRALPEQHSYPVGTYQIAEEATQYSGHVEYHAPRVASAEAWRQLIRDELPPSGNGLLICNDSISPKSVLRDLPSAWRWQIARVPTTRRQHATMNLPKGEFDAVIAYEPLSHLPHPWVSAKEIAAVVKPGGKLVTRELATPTLHIFKPDYWSFTSESLRLVYPPDLSLKQKFSAFLDPMVVIADAPEEHPLVPTGNCYRWACGIFEKQV